ncbi:metalloregulator ArsR/SmtB family transcription factor, partial [Mesorhizobium sp.]
MHVALDTMVDTLKAAAESSRLRILALLSRGDLTVSDLTEILGQSQPRVSRHLKLLLEAGLIGRYQEGSWAFFRLSDSDAARDFVLRLVSGIRAADPQVERDLERLAAVKRKRQDRAAEYFSVNAASWDHIRSLHVPDRAVEAALLKLVGKRPFQSMLDLGTGTGRLLEIFSPL